MNKAQRIALIFAIANVGLMLLFQPFDYVSLQRGGVPTFDGFYFAFGAHQNRVPNSNFLALEVLVVLINAGIALLLLRDAPARKLDRPGGNRRQRAVLTLIGFNLVLALLFPPFEVFSAISHAALPTFEGFYFLFADNSQRQIVMPILYIEVALILINGGLLWLLFKGKSSDDASAAQIRDLAQRVREAQRR